MNCTDWNDFHCLEDVNHSYHRFLDTEYTNRPHSSIGTTPRERYLKDFDTLRFLELRFIFTMEKVQSVSIQSTR